MAVPKFIPVYKVHRSFFFDEKNKPPPPHKGWSLEAFQEFCKEKLLDSGFDLERKITIRYEPNSGYVYFFQNPPVDDEMFPYSIN